jgi:hypothetical protein
MAIGTWSIHQSNTPMEAAKVKANKVPMKLIWISGAIPLSSLLKVIPDHFDAKQAIEQKDNPEDQRGNGPTDEKRLPQDVATQKDHDARRNDLKIIPPSGSFRKVGWS